MAPKYLDQSMLDSAILGGSFYGGGGGGPAEQAFELGRLALSYGNPTLVDISELADDESLLTVAAVGAPAAADQCIKPRDYMRSVELLLEGTSLKLAGFISNECGALACVNGWMQSAAFGIPLVDCPCNGRAHPTGIMGSMGLRWPEYLSSMAACGGSREKGSYIEAFVQGPPERAASLIRQVAVQAGGLVAVARNPIAVSYAKTHGAPGAFIKCISLGKAMNEASAQGSSAMIRAAVEVSKGTLHFTCRVRKKELRTTSGFDVGKVVLDNDATLTFWNEYITLEDGDARLATFPDLIATLNAETGIPLSTADIVEGQTVSVVTVPREALILGSGMRDRSLYRVIEEAVGKEVVSFVF